MELDNFSKKTKKQNKKGEKIKHMADLQNFSVTTASAVSVVVPRFTIQAKVVDSQSGATLADYTGGSALQFPSILATLSAQQRQDIIDLIATLIINQKAGLV